MNNLDTLLFRTLKVELEMCIVKNTKILRKKLIYLPGIRAMHI